MKNPLDAIFTGEVDFYTWSLLSFLFFLVSLIAGLVAIGDRSWWEGGFLLANALLLLRLTHILFYTPFRRGR